MSPSGLRTQFLILTNVLAVRNGDLAGGPGHGWSDKRARVCLISAAGPHIQALPGHPTPHRAHGGGLSTWGPWSPLCFFLSNDCDVDSVGPCVQRYVQSPGDMQLCRCGRCWDHLLLALGCGLGHRSRGSLCWEWRRAMSPTVGTSGSAAPPARVCDQAQFSSGRPEQRGLPWAPSLPGTGRGRSFVQPGLCRVEAVNQLDITR